MASQSSNIVKGRQIFISQLQVGRCSQRLVCRVSRLWKTFNPKKVTDLMSVDCVVIDEKGDAVTCVVRSRFVTEFDDLLKEGYVYVIKNFDVSLLKGGYRVLHDFEVFLQFDSATTVDELISDIPVIVPNKFSLIPYGQLAVVGERRKRLCDIIGFVHTVSDVGERMSNNQATKYQWVDLVDASGRKLRLTIWGDICTEATEKLIKGGCHVRIVTSTIVKGEDAATVTVSTSSATHFFGGLEIDEIREFVNRLEEGVIRDLPKRAQVYSPYILRSDFDKGERSIPQILELLEEDHKFEEMVFVYASISSIVEKNGWKYNACTECTCRVQYERSRYYCKKCNRYEDLPNVRYRVEVVLDNSSGVLNCVMFEWEVYKIVKITAPELARVVILEDSDDAIPRQLRRMIRKCFIFQLRFNNFDGGSKQDKFTVNRIIDESDIRENNSVEAGSLKPASNSKEAAAVVLKTSEVAEKRHIDNDDDSVGTLIVDADGGKGAVAEVSVKGTTRLKKKGRKNQELVAGED